MPIGENKLQSDLGACFYFIQTSFGTFTKIL